MNVFKAVKDAVNQIPEVKGRVYHAEALKNAAAPFVFWLQTGERFEQALDSRTELGQDRYELHVVTKNLESLDGISANVRAAAEALQGETVNGVLYETVTVEMITPVINEKEVNLYRKVYEVTINYQEE